MTDQASALRLAIAGASTLVVLFLLCWLGALAWPQGPSHMFISLFTAQAVDSMAALAMGGAAALLFGAISGALLAFSYNLTASLGRS